MGPPDEKNEPIDQSHGSGSQRGFPLATFSFARIGVNTTLVLKRGPVTGYTALSHCLMPIRTSRGLALDC